MLGAAAQSAPPLWVIIPFALLLASIATGPALFAHFWHRFYPVIALALGAVTVGFYVYQGDLVPLLHSLEEYVGFIALIGSLFVVSGGIHIQVKGEATPRLNCFFLFCGAVLANIIGTTGASMLLIRPWIRMNWYRRTGFHVVFFIFIVSNVGGCLTPIGDPPLFMGYLKGVPFDWVIRHCWQGWFVVVLGLIGIFYVFDRINFLRAPKQVRDAETGHSHWAVRGLHNVIYIVAILGAVLFLPFGWREGVMAVAALASMFTTHRDIHNANDFNFEPLKEVVYVFAGIFATMIPALQYLQTNPPPLASAHGYYWATGALSGLLDNAPTYLAFLATAMGQQGMSLDQPADVMRFAGTQVDILQAISLGAVFFGAMTYVGNGPNFMVKAIADSARIPCPNFIQYVVKYAIPILLPFLAIVGILFFSSRRIFA